MDKHKCLSQKPKEVGEERTGKGARQGRAREKGARGKRRGEAKGTKEEVVTYNTTITTGAHLCVPNGWMLVIPKIFKITPNITQAKLKKYNLLKASSSYSIMSYQDNVGYWAMSRDNLGS